MNEKTTKFKLIKTQMKECPGIKHFECKCGGWIFEIAHFENIGKNLEGLVLMCDGCKSIYQLEIAGKLKN